MLCFVMYRGREGNIRPLLHDPDAPKIAILHYETALQGGPCDEAHISSQASIGLKWPNLRPQRDCSAG